MIFTLIITLSVLLYSEFFWQLPTAVKKPWQTAVDALSEIKLQQQIWCN